MKRINSKYLALFFAILSILLFGTKMGLAFGLCGILFGLSTLFRYRSSSYKKTAKAGCILSLLALVLNASLLFFVGSEQKPVSLIHESLISLADKSVSPKDAEVIQKVDRLISGFLSKNSSESDTSSSPVPQGDSPADMEVHFLDVGQGLSILIESDGHYMLYDGGDRNASSFVVSYLEDAGVKKLDYVIASHYDADHLNGIVGALNAYPTDTVFAPDYETDTKVFESFLNVTNEKGIPVVHPQVGSSYSLGNAGFTVLGPIGTDYEDKNDYSIVIMLQNGNDRFLITGDSEYTSEAQLCASGADLSCTVYVAGHHGSGTSSSWDLMEQAVPEYAVISCGKNNKYGHPHEETMEKLEVMEIETFRTDLQGTILCSSSGNGLHWSVSPCNDYTPGT